MKMCEHKEFKATVAVNRLEDTGQFCADVTINCADCGKPFQFLGLEPGVDTQGARCSLDGLEARLAIAPEGTKPNPFQRMAHGVNRLS